MKATCIFKGHFMNSCVDIVIGRIYSYSTTTQPNNYLQYVVYSDYDNKYHIYRSNLYLDLDKFSDYFIDLEKYRNDKIDEILR